MPATLQDLRALLATRFPERKRPQAGCVATGATQLDEAMGGGLPLGKLTEWVAAGPSSGTQLALVQLLTAARQQGLRVALVDAADTFAPESLPDDQRDHLVWIRGRDLATALAATDLLVHDGNFRLVLLDVREVALGPLQRWPATGWYRLQRAVEEGGGALLCCTPAALVPSATVRLTFASPCVQLTDRWRPRPELTAALAPVRQRGQALPESRRLAG